MKTGMFFGRIHNRLDELLDLAMLATVLESKLPLLLATAWLDCRRLFRRLAPMVSPRLLHVAPQRYPQPHPFRTFAAPA